MIDERRIEEAAQLDDKEYYDRLSDNDRCFFEYGFRRGYNRALKDLWHPASEEPKENFDLVYINKTKEFREISSYNSDRFDDLFGKGWDAACRMFGIYKWLYLDDLFPEEGGNQ